MSQKRKEKLKKRAEKQRRRGAVQQEKPASPLGVIACSCGSIIRHSIPACPVCQSIPETCECGHYFVPFPHQCADVTCLYGHAHWMCPACDDPEDQPESNYGCSNSKCRSHGADDNGSTEFLCASRYYASRSDSDPWDEMQEAKSPHEAAVMYKIQCLFADGPAELVEILYQRTTALYAVYESQEGTAFSVVALPFKSRSEFFDHKEQFRINLDAGLKFNRVGKSPYRLIAA